MRAHNFKDLSGKVFGKWKVLPKYEVRVSSRGKQTTYWLCVCECGTEKFVIGGQLAYGSTTQCKSCGSSGFKGEAARNTVLCGYKLDAKDRGYEWSLTDEQAFVLMSMPCFYCGTEPSNVCRNKYGTGDYVYTGIDRKHNCFGYTTDNSVSCCKICNRAKSDLNYEEWLSYLSRIAARQKG